VLARLLKHELKLLLWAPLSLSHPLEGSIDFQFREEPNNQGLKDINVFMLRSTATLQS